MINLIPLEEKKYFVAERKKRIILSLVVLVLIFFIYFDLILLSESIYIKSAIFIKEYSYSRFGSEAKQAEIKKFEDQINSANKSLAEMSGFFDKKVYFSALMQKVALLMVNNSYLIDISIDSGEAKDKSKIIKVSLSGFAAKRDDLFKIKDNFEKETEFKELDFPASNWVKAENINFTISFVVPAKK
jgi:hypothetical protein